MDTMTDHSQNELREVIRKPTPQKESRILDV